ncbi:MAG: hypothetical protein U1D55_12285 [Phycisphaerae bacterium]
MTAAQKRAAERRRQTPVREIDRHDDHAAFDAASWRRVKRSERLLRIWRLTCEQHLLRGGDARELTLDRSVVRVCERESV